MLSKISYLISWFNDTNNIFSAFMKIIGQCRRIFLLWCLFSEVYSLL